MTVMFAKARQEIMDAQASLKTRLVELYQQVRTGQLTEEQRRKLEEAIREIKKKLGPQTRKLCGQKPEPEV
jgi:hypothetical protein